MKTTGEGPKGEKGGGTKEPKAIVELLLRLILGGIFLYSGGIKLVDPAAFQNEIANFQLIPRGLAGVVAVYLPWLEIACGAALVVKRQFFGGALLLGLLVLGFIFFLGSAWARGLDLSCGCFGASDSLTNYPLAIARNLAILAGLAAMLWAGKSAETKGGWNEAKVE